MPRPRPQLCRRAETARGSSAVPSRTSAAARSLVESTSSYAIDVRTNGQPDVFPIEKDSELSILRSVCPTESLVEFGFFISRSRQRETRRAIAREAGASLVGKARQPDDSVNAHAGNDKQKDDANERQRTENDRDGYDHGGQG